VEHVVGLSYNYTTQHRLKLGILFGKWKIRQHLIRRISQPAIISLGHKGGGGRKDRGWWA
jgi:hypothetical protein